MAVSKRLRYEILRRDQHTCRYCGATAPDVPLRIDHVTPVALGGADTPDNLVTACQDCNSGKSSASPDAHHVANVSDDALRWAAAMKQAAEDLRQKQTPKIAYREFFRKAWAGWTREVGWKTQAVELPDGWKGSLDAFHQAGLPQEVWPDVIEKAMTNPTVKVDNTFRYACGIAWRMVRDLQDAASRMVGARPVESRVVSHLNEAITEAWAASWEADHEEAVSDQDRTTFIKSLTELREEGDAVGADRLMKAASMGGCAQKPTIQESLAQLLEEERAEIVMDWVDAWVAFAGSQPTLQDMPYDSDYTTVQRQVDALADVDPSLTRTRRAAVVAAYHRSTGLHHGLKKSDLKVLGVTAWRQNAVDCWARSYWAAAGRWPSDEEQAAFREQLNRSLGSFSSLYLSDVEAAASAAGAYRDPDLSTCLPVHDSVFEAAALLPQLAA